MVACWEYWRALYSDTNLVEKMAVLLDEPTAAWKAAQWADLMAVKLVATQAVDWAAERIVG